MCPSSSSPPQTPVTTLDEPHNRSVKSPLHICPNRSADHATRPQTDSPSSSSQPPAPPTPPISSSRHSTASTSASNSAIQSKLQPNSPSQNLTTMSISINSNPSCVMFPEHTASLRRDQPVKVSSQSLDSGIVDPVSLSTESRQSITPSFSFPGASSSAATYDRIFPDSADSHCTSITASSTESISATSERTPNVYINGLPAHFSEQALFALARPFGNIKSVRTFTRHVSEKPTLVFLVLILAHLCRFNDAESAQRCIEGLRKYRNLHPSFSKQVHRIPGTEYAQHHAAQLTDQDENTFKSRMEKLKDTASTNLYIEGLPLSIDKESLAALMLPYKIKSSRFFKTKLSNPPRIIAFVRLETRAAAEETIERLHGRMVRGWDDPGCRISVRFADSAEQRELRRAERTLKNGDQSPSRITIAQAALLNLRGQEFQANAHDVSGVKPQRLGNPRLDNRTTFNPSANLGLLPTSRSLPSKLCYTYRESPLLSASDFPIASEMDTLLRSMQNTSYDDGSLDSTMRGLTLDSGYLMTQQPQLRALANAALLSPNPLPNPLPRGHTQARNGFTSAEELILEAHARRLQFQAQLSQTSSIFEPTSSLRKLNANVRSFDPASHETRSGLAGMAMLPQDALPAISENDFHAMGHPPCSFSPTSHEFQGLVDSGPPNVPAATSTIFVRPPSRAVSIVPPPPDYEEPGKRPKDHHQRAERLTGSKQISYPSPSFNNRQSIPSGESKLHPSMLQASSRPNNISNSNSNSNISTISCDKNIELQPTYMHSHGDARSYPKEDRGPRFRSSPASHIYTKKSPQLGGEQHSTVKEGPKSPAVVSPALTYSSRTPSTLSPATPFFGSFAGSQDAFEVMTMENEDVAERKLKARVTTK
ncbi:hypothetical protein J3R83DRAFT_10676 [Lanmaoa asiatica]|nr:hypothetical protein J3R83DRAFT_10676 [Lanmaoa asiatica]